MRKILPLLAVGALFAIQVKAQKSWKYDFSTSTGNLSPVAAAGMLSADDGDPAHIHSLLPAPADGQIARIWTGNRVDNNDLNSYLGGFSLTTQGSIGTGSKLLFNVAPTASTHKFSILNIDGTALMSVGFKLRFEAGTSAEYRFVIGRDASTMNWSTALPSSGATQFSNNINFNDANTLPTILLMQWRLTSSGYKLIIRKNKSSANGTLDGFEELNTVLNPTISFINGGTYDIQVYANNSNASTTYIKSGTQTVAARSCHIWVNNTQLLFEANNPNFKDAGTSLAANSALNAFMMLGYNNTDNNAQAYLDDFVYANYLTNITTLPVVLDGFSATRQNNRIVLNWKTLSEKDNARFEILRAGEDENFKLIKTVPGKGNSSTALAYSAIDNSPLLGNNYYKLVQIDHNGQADTLAVALAKISLSDNNLHVYAEGNSIRLAVNSVQQENAVVEIYNIEGQRLVAEKTELKEGNNQLFIPVKLAKGVYVAVLKIKNSQQKTKFVCGH